MFCLGRARLSPTRCACAALGQHRSTQRKACPAIKRCARGFVELCRATGLLTTASVAIDGSKFKAVNNRDRNFTKGKVDRRRAQLEESVARYLSQLDTADHQMPTEALVIKTEHLKQKLVKLEDQMKNPPRMRSECWLRPTSRSRRPIPTVARHAGGMLSA